MTTSDYLKLEGALGALRDVSWKHCLALSGSSGLLSEALLEPGTRNSSSRASTVPTAHGCHRALPGGTSMELRRRRAGSALTHYTLQASAGVAPRRRTTKITPSLGSSRSRSELLDMVKAGYGGLTGPRCQNNLGSKYSQQRTGGKRLFLFLDPDLLH